MTSGGRSGSGFQRLIKLATAAQWTAWAMVGIAILAAPRESAGQVVNIADPNLEQAIRDAVNKPAGDLT